MPLQKTEVKDTHDDQQQQLDGASRIQVEIVYVAASQKPTKQVKEEEKDTIVVVCQARQKRKRTKAQLQQNGTEKSNEPTADEVPSSSTLPLWLKLTGLCRVAEQESFLYANIYD